MNTPEHIKSKFLPLKQSKSLCNIGFDEECFAYYENQDEHLVVFYSNFPLTEEQEKRASMYRSEIRNSVLPQWATAAPLIQDAMEWFFDHFRLFGEVFMDDDMTFGYCISRPALVNGVEGRMDYPMKRQFKTKADAKIACIENMIRIVVENRHLDEARKDAKPITRMMESLNLLNSDRPADSLDLSDEINKRILDEIQKNAQEKKK